MKKVTYRQSGVDIKKADEFVARIDSFIGKSPLARLAAFGSLFDLKPWLKNCSDPVLVSSTDGVGTKLKVAQRLGVHHTVGIDLVGMNVNDILCVGAKPLFFLDYIACGRVDVRVLGDVVSGINRGLTDAGCKLLGEETAEMPGMYAKDEYDLAGFCVGIVDRKKIIDGSRMKSGDVVIGLASNGLHSNGFSLVRKVLGPAGIRRYGTEILKPTAIYVKPVLSLINALPVKAIAHITGGSFYKKATKIVPAGLSLSIEKGSWPVPEIFEVIRRKGRIPEKEMYTVLNMGIGMMIVVDRRSAAGAVNILNGQGVSARVIGVVKPGREKLRLA